jgi:hypothetical protein
LLIALGGFGVGDWLSGVCILALGVLGIGLMGFALLLGLFGWVCSLLDWVAQGIIDVFVLGGFRLWGCSRHFGCCRLWGALDTWVCYGCWVVGPFLALVGRSG